MTQLKRLSLVLAINAAMIVGLLIVGLASHSLGVLAAGGDYVADSVAIVLGIMAIQIAKHPQGHPRATIYVALLNSLVLLGVTIFVVVEGVRRLMNNTPEIHALSVLIVSLIAMTSMVIAVIILGSDAGSEDLHMRSVLLDTISDAVASGGVALSGAIIYFTGSLDWLDSAIAVLIGVVIGVGALRLLRDVIVALRTGSGLAVTDG